MDVLPRPKSAAIGPTDPGDPTTIAIRRLVAGLIALQLLLAAANFTWLVDDTAAGEIFDLNRESNLIVWFTSMLLWTIALLAAYAGIANWSSGACSAK